MEVKLCGFVINKVMLNRPYLFRTWISDFFIRRKHVVHFSSIADSALEEVSAGVCCT